MKPLNLAVVQPEGALQLDLTWDAVTGAAAYNLYRDGEILQAGIASNAASDTAIEYNVQYVYAVTSISEEDVESDQSIPVIGVAFGGSDPFATVADLGAYWKPITGEAEIARATMLLNIASNRLRITAGDTIDLDEKSADSPHYKLTLQWIVMEAVKRAMQSPVDQPSVESYAQTAGVYSENFKYSNPTGDLFFRKSELAALGLSGSQSLSSITPITESDIYSED